MDEVEELVPALLDPVGSLLAEEPVWVVVPAVPPEPVCDDPLAEVDVEAEPLPVLVGVGVGVAVGLDELDALLPVPVDDWPELEVPPAVLAVPAPDPWAVVPPVSVGVVWVFEPVLVAALPVLGVLEPLEVLPASAVDELPVEADADAPLPDPEFAEVEEFVLVVALADPPVAVVVVVGVGVVVVEVGDGVGVGVDVGDDPAVPVHQFVCEPPELLFACDPAPVFGVEVGAGVGVVFGVAVAAVLVVVVEVVEVVEVFDEPPLIDGFTLMIGCTVITGALLTTATAFARAPPRL